MDANTHVSSSGATTVADARTMPTPTLYGLPDTIIKLIATHLDSRSALALSRVCKRFQEPTRRAIWRELDFTLSPYWGCRPYDHSHLTPTSLTGPSRVLDHEAAYLEEFSGAARALRVHSMIGSAIRVGIRSDLLDSIERMTFQPREGVAGAVSTLLSLVRDSLRRLDVVAPPFNLDTDARSTFWPQMMDIEAIRISFPQLRELRVSIPHKNNESLSVVELLKVTPHLEKIVLQAGFPQNYSYVTRDLLRDALPDVKTLTVDVNEAFEGYFAPIPQTLLSACPNVVRLTLLSSYVGGRSSDRDQLAPGTVVDSNRSLFAAIADLKHLTDVFTTALNFAAYVKYVEETTPRVDHLPKLERVVLAPETLHPFEETLKTIRLPAHGKLRHIVKFIDASAEYSADSYTSELGQDTSKVEPIEEDVAQSIERCRGFEFVVFADSKDGSPIDIFKSDHLLERETDVLEGQPTSEEIADPECWAQKGYRGCVLTSLFHGDDRELLICRTLRRRPVRGAEGAIDIGPPTWTEQTYWKGRMVPRSIIDAMAVKADVDRWKGRGIKVESDVWQILKDWLAAEEKKEGLTTAEESAAATPAGTAEAQTQTDSIST